MNLFVKSFPLAAILSLAMATTASAIQPDSVTSIKLTDRSLIAQTPPPGNLVQQVEARARRFINQMMMIHIQMIESAEEALQSQNPEIRRMAQQTIKTSNAEIDKLMDMRGRGR